MDRANSLVFTLSVSVNQNSSAEHTEDMAPTGKTRVNVFRKRVSSVHQFDREPKKHKTKGKSIPLRCCVFGPSIPDSVGEKFPGRIPQIT